MGRFLIVTDDRNAYKRVEELLKNRGVVAKLPPHLIEGQFVEDDVCNLPEGARVYRGSIPPEELESLPPMVQTAANAFVMARDVRPSSLEGLPWDTPGFDAPG